MGNAAGRRKFWEGILRVRRPVRTLLANVNKSGAEGERGMARVVADGEHFVAQGRYKKQVDIRENACHFHADFAAEAVSLHKIYSREKTRLAKEIRPGVVRLHFELIGAAGEGELLEGSGALSKKIEIERAIGPIGEKDFYGDHAKSSDGFEGCAIHVGGR